MESPSLAAPEAAPATDPNAPLAAPPRERLSPQVQALMRKEADAQRKLQEARKMETAIKAERESMAAERAKIDAWNNSWKENPLKAIQERGLSPEQLWMMQQQGGQMTAEVQLKLLQQEMAALREERNGEKSEAQKAAEAQAEKETADRIQEFQDEIAGQLEAAKDKYPLTHLYKRADLIYSIIDRHHDKTETETGTGEVMSIEKASELVEARLLSEAKKAQEILLKTEQATTQQQSSQATGRRFQAPSEQHWVEKPIRTLAGISQSAPSAKPTHFLNDQERVERAVARLRAAKQR